MRYYPSMNIGVCRGNTSGGDRSLNGEFTMNGNCGQAGAFCHFNRGAAAALEGVCDDTEDQDREGEERVELHCETCKGDCGGRKECCMTRRLVEFTSQR